MNYKTLLTIILFFIAQLSLAQSKKGTISGKLIEKDGKPAVGITIMIEGQTTATTTDADGYFELKNIPEGDKTIVITGIGYTTIKKSVSIFNNSKTEISETIEEANHHLGEIAVQGKSESQQVKESGYSVNSLEIKPLQNLNLDLNTVLNQTSGIRIRQEGGLGSSFNLLLNGFANNQVRFFIDGVPMDNFGSSLTLNNIPVNLVSRIDIYKGVIPVFLGADALGGAINVITDQKKRNFADVAYSYGSFNTHRASAITRVTDEKTGITVNSKGIFNYSDNTYWINTEVPNSATSKANGEERLQRFHDGYQSQTVELEAGVINKKYADRLFIGCIASSNYKEIQSGVNMTKVSGEAYTTDKVLIPTFKYTKSNLFTKGLEINLYANYNIRQALVADTSSKEYNWRGEYYVRDLRGNEGELYWDKTLFRFNDKSVSSVSNLKYELSKNHSFSLNNTYSHYTRVGNDPISVSAIPFGRPNTLIKNITGISYDANFFSGRFKLSVFGKNFLMNASTQEEDVTDKLMTVNRGYSFQGYGVATSLFIFPWLLGKTSYENTLRMPDASEMFGNGLLVQPNTGLKPEKSQNFNIGLISTVGNGKHKLILEGGYLYRLPQNLIRQGTTGVLSVYENVAAVRVSCIEASAKYLYDKHLAVEINGTYQDMININKYEPSGAQSVLYLDRLPNIPFMFGNFSISLSAYDVFSQKSKLTFGLSTNYVAGFYLKWPSQGDKDAKYTVPDQINNSISLSYSLRNDKYNISLACNNIADARLYDNFMMQKPGRAFSVKLRYFISKS